MPKPEVYLTKPCMEMTDTELNQLVNKLRKTYHSSVGTYIGVPREQACQQIEDAIDRTHVVNKESVKGVTERISNELVMALALDPDNQARAERLAGLRALGASEETATITEQDIEEERQKRLQKKEAAKMKRQAKKREKDMAAGLDPDQPKPRRRRGKSPVAMAAASGPGKRSKRRSNTGGDLEAIQDLLSEYPELYEQFQ